MAVSLTWDEKNWLLIGDQKKGKYEEVFLKSQAEIEQYLKPRKFEHLECFGNARMVDLNQQNFIFRGNNLPILASLEHLAGSIKLIYIDPPYNTGSAAFKYHDKYSHGAWLSFMKSRLAIAWRLLAKDGAIFIHLDDTEMAYLKVLCDELFGRENFKESIVLKSSTESGVNAVNVKRGEKLFKVKEHILYYTKAPTVKFKPFFTKTHFNKNYRYLLEKIDNGYIVKDLAKDHKGEDLEKVALANADRVYSIEKNIKKAGEKYKAAATKAKETSQVVEFTNSKGQLTLFYDGGVLVPLKERIIKENEQVEMGLLASDLWVDIPTTAAKEGGIAFANGKKPEKLLQRIIEMCTEPGDRVLDFFLGSGTTAAVAHKMNRRYIGIEQMDYGPSDPAERLRNVIKGEQSGISKAVKWKGGGGFIQLTLHHDFYDPKNADDINLKLYSPWPHMQ